MYLPPPCPTSLTVRRTMTHISIQLPPFDYPYATGLSIHISSQSQSPVGTPVQNTTSFPYPPSSQSYPPSSPSSQSYPPSSQFTQTQPMPTFMTSPSKPSYANNMFQQSYHTCNTPQQSFQPVPAFNTQQPTHPFYASPDSNTQQQYSTHNTQYPTTTGNISKIGRASCRERV